MWPRLQCGLFPTMNINSLPYEKCYPVLFPSSTEDTHRLLHNLQNLLPLFLGLCLPTYHFAMGKRHWLFYLAEKHQAGRNSMPNHSQTGKQDKGRVTAPGQEGRMGAGLKEIYNNHQIPER